MTRTSSQRPAALITGAAKRVGRHLALHLAGRGYDIALHYHTSRTAAEAAAKEIRALSADCELFAADLVDTAATKLLFADVRKQFPRLSLLINNASIFEAAPLSRTKAADLDRNFAVHVRAPFLLSAAFARQVRKGLIINILDTRVEGLNNSHAAYLLSKKSLRDLTLLAAKEFAPRVRVNAIAPGLILPPPGEDQAYLTQRSQGIPLQTTGAPDDIARAVDYLIASPFVTGQILYQDGGEHLNS